MTARTWPYGTRLKAEVIYVGGLVVMAKDENEEVHTIVTVGMEMRHRFKPTEGDKVIMEFTQGCPTCGYWRIVEKQA